MTRLIKRFGNENGSAMVEFALVASILFLLLFGIIQLGLVFNIQLSLDYVAREGVRLAAYPGTLTDDQIKTQMTTMVPSSVGLQTSSIAITPTVRQRGQPVTVTINYTYKTIVTMGVLPTSYNLSASAVMVAGI